MGNVELEQTSYIGFVIESRKLQNLFQFFTAFSAEEKILLEKYPL
jgi:hypothetical protein